MTKVTTKISNDVISKHGRHVNIQIISTDDELLNNFMQLPKNINKKFTPSTSIEDIMTELQIAVKSVVDNAKNNMSANKIVGKEITFDV